MPSIDECPQTQDQPAKDLARERTGNAALRFMATRAITATATLLLSRGLLSRHFSKPELGVFNEAMTFASLLPMFLMLGLPKAIYYFFPRTTERRRFLHRAVLVSLATGTLGGLGFYVFAPTIAVLLDNDGVVPHALAITAYVAACVVAQLADPILISRGRSTALSISVVLTGALNLVLLYLTVRLKWDVSHLLWSLASLQIVPAAFGLLGIRGATDEVGSPAPSLKRLFGYMLPLAVSSLSIVVMTYLDRFVVMRKFPGDHDLFATYSIGAMEIPIVASIVYSCLNVLMPRYSDCHHRGDHVGVATLYRNVTSVLAVIMAPVFGFFLVFGGTFIIWLHPENYASSIPIFLTYLFFVPLRIFGADVLLQALGEARVMVRYSVLGLIFNLFLALALTTASDSLLAPAISTVISTGVFLCWLPLRHGARTLGFSISALVPFPHLLRIIGALVLSCGLAYGFGYIASSLGFARFPTLLFGGILYLGFYAGAALVTRAVTREDFRRLKAQIQRR